MFLRVEMTDSSIVVCSSMLLAEKTKLWSKPDYSSFIFLYYPEFIYSDIQCILDHHTNVLRTSQKMYLKKSNQITFIHRLLNHSVLGSPQFHHETLGNS